MARLNIRNLPDEVHAKLRLRAAKAGRSMEAEARNILAAACAAEPGTMDPSRLQALVDELYGGHKPAGVVEKFIHERRRQAASE